MVALILYVRALCQRCSALVSSAVMSAEDLIPSDRLDESGEQSGPSENRSIEFPAWLDLLHKDPSS